MMNSTPVEPISIQSFPPLLSPTHGDLSYIMSAWLLCAGVTAFDLSLRTAIALRCSVFPWENESTVLQYREMVWCWDALGLVSLILTRARLFSTVHNVRPLFFLREQHGTLPPPQFSVTYREYYILVAGLKFKICYICFFSSVRSV